MRNAWVRACTGKHTPAPPIEMLRLITGWSWGEIEEMTDASGNSSSKIHRQLGRRRDQAKHDD
jgi:hypothetical protein